MKLYRVDSFKQYEQSEYPKNIKLEAHRIELEGIYLVDNGNTLYVLVGEDVSNQKLREIVGVEKVEEIQNLVEIPNT